MQKRFAFTMIELIFVIVIMGIIGKFGVEFLAQAYTSYMYEKINHTLQTNSGMAVEQIAKRLEYRIKDSVIARISKTTDPVPINDINLTQANSYTVLEWIAYDNEGFRGLTKPYWSGIIDLDSSNANVLTSPDSNTTAEDAIIHSLSNNMVGLANAALYFVGSNADVKIDFGWSGVDHNQAWIDAQRGAMHPIQAETTGGSITQFKSATATNFAGVDLYEYYQLAWTAYAVVMEDYNATTNKGNLVLYWGYQPWEGDTIATADYNATLMKDVSTFQFMSIGSIMKIQVCTKSDLLEEHSLCKEKTVF